MKKFILAVLLWMWSGAAHALVTCSVTYPALQVGDVADPAQINQNNMDLIDCLTRAAAAGANSDITSLNLLTPISQVGGGSSVYTGGTSTGTANAQTIVATTPSGFALVPGLSVMFKAGSTNTGPMTLAVSPTAATSVFKSTPSGPQALTGGEVIAGNMVLATYDGTGFQIISVGAQFGGFGPLVTTSAAATVDLGTFGSHNVGITFTGISITSLGSTASLTYPIYRLSFAANVVLMNSASLLLPGGASITTNLNDTAIAVYTGGGNWQVTQYNRANGTSVINSAPLCGFSGLQMSRASVTTVNWQWNSAVLINPTGNVPIFSSQQMGT